MDIVLRFIDVFFLLFFNYFKRIFIIVYGFCFSGDVEWVKEMMLSFLNKVFYYLFYFFMQLICFMVYIGVGIEFMCIMKQVNYMRE